MKYELNFKIGTTSIMTLDVDTNTRTSNLKYISSDEVLMHPLFLPNERNYLGLEKRFQWWFNERSSLADFIKIFQEHGFFFDGQSNLKLNITELKGE